MTAPREGDRVRVVSEGDKDYGLIGYVRCVDSLALFYVVASKFDSYLYGPFTASELEPVARDE